MNLWTRCLALWASSIFARGAFAAETHQPLVGDDVVFAETDGLVAVEAEHFFQQTHSDKRAWHVTTAESPSGIAPDGDSSHVAGASGGAYLEALPDTRRVEGEPLISGVNFSNEPGRLAILHYKVHFQTPGRYYVWARAYSTGNEDNGLHVGLDGGWPASGQRMQWTAKADWSWESKQRTETVHTGVPGQVYLDIDSPGEHTIMFSMREDGFEFDQWVMTRDRDFAPVDEQGRRAQLKSGRLPAAFPEVTANGPANKVCY